MLSATDLVGMSSEKRSGIAVFGSVLVDKINVLEKFPSEGQLTKISELEVALGGLVPNVAIDLKRISKDLPVIAGGRVGADSEGELVKKTLIDEGVDISALVTDPDCPTSFTQVMSVKGGQRTFFTFAGASARYGFEDIDFDSLNAEILHLGYFLLLDKVDSGDGERILREAKKRGITTSIDLVSDSAGNYGRRVIPVLKYCNYVIINETECCGIWEIDPRHPDGRIHEENVRLAMQKCIDAGVGDLVVVHCKECCFALTAKGKFTTVPSLCVPPEDVKGTVGAGDAFCAGCLYAIYNHYTDQQMLEYASAAAACNLMEANAIDGMKPRNEIILLAEKYGRIAK